MKKLILEIRKNNEMKKTLFSLMAVILLSSGGLMAQELSAQSGPSDRLSAIKADQKAPPRDAENAVRTLEHQVLSETQGMVEKLNLSQKQSMITHRLFSDIAAEKEATRERFEGNKASIDEVLKELDAQKEQRFQQLLTEEQLAIYKTLKF